VEYFVFSFKTELDCKLGYMKSATMQWTKPRAVDFGWDNLVTRREKPRSRQSGVLGLAAAEKIGRDNQESLISFNATK
jgi:hypothetical protein